MHARAPDFLTGVIAPMFTPRFSDGRLDLEGARNHVRWLKSRRCVTSVFARSGVGEMYAFTVEETRQFIGAVLEEAAGEIGVLAGCAGEFDDNPEHRPDPARYVAQAVSLSRWAEEHGAQAVVHVMPVALRVEAGLTLQDAIFDYYRAINDAVGIPVILYQSWGTPDEYCITPSLLRCLLTLPRIAGMKLSTDAHAVFDPIAEVVADSGFALIAGAEHFYLEALGRGASGVIGGGCNTHPEIIYAVGRHHAAGRSGQARCAQEQVTQIVRELDALGVPGAVAGKLYIAAQGYPMEPYNHGERALPAPEVMAQFSRIIDSRVSPYRAAVQNAGYLP